MKRTAMQWVAGALALTLAASLAWGGRARLRVQAEEPSKEEAVSIKTDADGNPYRVTVENVLRGSSEKGDIRDVSRLSDIRNRNGEEQYTAEGNGRLVWNNLGSDIVYEGDADPRDLPVGVKLTYYLNGRKITPEKLAGKSGRVKIRFEYENRTEGEDYVPFVFFSAALLDADLFHNVTVENGQTSRMGEYVIASGLAVPGLADALKLKAYEKTKDMDIPEYLEIEADAEEFAMDFTATMVVNGLFEEIELDGLDDIESMLDDVDAINDATHELSNGMGELLNGAAEFRDGLQKYTDGTREVSDGAAELRDGVAELQGGMGQLTDGAGQLASGLAQLHSGLEKMDTSKLSGGSKEEMQALSDAAAAILESGTSLGEALAALQSKMAGVDTQALAQAVEAAFQSNGAIGAQTAQMQETAAALETQIAALSEQIAAQETLLAGLRTRLEESPEDAALLQAVEEAEGILQNLTAVRDGLAASGTELAGQVQAIGESVPQTGNSLGEIATGLQTLSEALDPQSMEDIAADAEGIRQGLTQLLPALQKFGELGKQLSSLGGRIQELKDGVSKLNDGASALSSGVSQLAGGVSQLNSGAGELADGAKELAEKGTELTDGYSELYDGIGKAADGAARFRREVQEALAEMEQEELREIFSALRSVKAADDSYRTFSGASEDVRSSVRFLFETDAIK